MKSVKVIDFNKNDTNIMNSKPTGRILPLLYVSLGTMCIAMVMTIWNTIVTGKRGLIGKEWTPSMRRSRLVRNVFLSVSINVYIGALMSVSPEGEETLSPIVPTMWALTTAIDRYVLVLLQRPGKLDVWFTSVSQLYDLQTAPIVAIYATGDYGNVYKPVILTVLVFISTVMEYMLCVSADVTQVNAISLAVNRLQSTLHKHDVPSDLTLLDAADLKNKERQGVAIVAWANTLQDTHAWLKTYPTMVALEIAIFQTALAVLLSVVYSVVTVWQNTYWHMARWIFVIITPTIGLLEIIFILLTTSSKSLKRCQWYDPATDDDYLNYRTIISSYLNGERGLQLDSVGKTETLTLTTSRILFGPIRKILRYMAKFLSLPVFDSFFRIKKLTLDLLLPNNNDNPYASLSQKDFDSILEQLQIFEDKLRSLLKKESNESMTVLVQKTVLAVFTHIHATVTEAEIQGITRWNENPQFYQSVQELSICNDFEPLSDKIQKANKIAFQKEKPDPNDEDELHMCTLNIIIHEELNYVLRWLTNRGFSRGWNKTAISYFFQAVEMLDQLEQDYKRFIPQSCADDVSTLYDVSTRLLIVFFYEMYVSAPTAATNAPQLYSYLSVKRLPRRKKSFIALAVVTNILSLLHDLTNNLQPSETIGMLAAYQKKRTYSESYGNGCVKVINKAINSIR